MPLIQAQSNLFSFLRLPSNLMQKNGAGYFSFSISQPCSFRSYVMQYSKQNMTERFKPYVFNFNLSVVKNPFYTLCSVAHVCNSNREFLTWATKFMTWTTK